MAALARAAIFLPSTQNHSQADTLEPSLFGRVLGIKCGNRRSPVIVSEDAMKYGLLWLLGVPIPVLIVLYLLFH